MVEQLWVRRGHDTLLVALLEIHLPNMAQVSLLHMVCHLDVVNPSLSRLAIQLDRNVHAAVVCLGLVLALLIVFGVGTAEDLFY